VTQPLTEMSNRMSPGGKGARCVGLITFSLSCAVRPEILGAPNVWNPQGPAQACNGIALPLLSKRAFGVRTQQLAKRVTRSTLTFQQFQTELT
jgi:hypothetical protein